MFTIISKNYLTSTGAGIKLNNPSNADLIVVENLTTMAASNPNKAIRTWSYAPSWGANASPADGGFKTVKTTFDLTSSISSSGFTWVYTSPQVEAQNANAITAITAADPAVVSQTNSYSEDDILQFYGTTGMLQISGMNFQISNVSGSGYDLVGLDASGFAAAATAGNTRRISKMLAVNPQFLYVTDISQAAQAVVRTSVDPSAYYVVGMKLHFNIPVSFGMKEMDQLTGTIVSIDSSAYTMTVDIDSSAFTAFAFPASSLSPTARLFATVAPAGASTQFDPITSVETGYDFQFQPFRTGQFTPYVYLGAGDNSPAGNAMDKLNIIMLKSET